jgi:formylglycine-generating enzyme required for sulfatase activity
VTRERPVPAAAPKPSWAKTSRFQDEYAAKVGLPVWEEVAVGGGESLKFVLIPPTTASAPEYFVMGSPDGTQGTTKEDGRDDDETQHEVELTRPYYLSIHEVTNGQYRRFKASHDSGRYEGQSLNGPQQPVVLVSHEDAMSFVDWLKQQKRGREFRLPTESEWEYACRAGTTTPFSVGRTISTDQANFNGNFTYAGGPKGEYLRRTTDVGTFAPNGWGLYDVHGNVWEWCADWYGPYPPGRLRDPQGPTTSSDSARVLRGGSWFSIPVYVRSADRHRNAPDDRDNNMGFRVVLAAPPK